ncbi:6059_t:CDS:2 [Paraglomus brasilianum]|uniref:6059_t:CDS:1 n=1 Tax=Paraglomus brasilianum TaxID=144538 RepID=A0A9N9DC72_9GLOM|nr:6059_t:CDS:2 [Paraglomus brasilianum]
MGPPKAWFKLMNTKSTWGQVPLTGVENVYDLKKAIKSEVAPELDTYASVKLTLKATKMVKDVNKAIELDEEQELASILKNFDMTVLDDVTWVQRSFAKNIRLFVYTPSETMPIAKKARIDRTLASILEGQTLKQQPDSPEFLHNFYDRRKFIKEVIPVVTSNYNNHGNIDHKVHTFMLLPGGSGIGKSRSGWELQHLVTHADYFGFKFDIRVSEIDLFREALQNPYYLHIDLNNGYSYDQQFDEKYSASVRIGARLAVASGLSDVQLSDMMDNYPVELFSMPEIIQEIFKRRFEAHNRTLDVLIIHIDEYQVYINDAQQANRSWDKARNFFKQMLKAIGSIMRTNIVIDGHPNKQYFVVPICTGTSAIDIHFLPTDHTRKIIPLKPLDYTSAVEMFRDKYEYSRQTTDKNRMAVKQSIMKHHGGSLSDSDINKFSTKLCNLILEQSHFNIALHDTGFIPKFIDDFLQHSEPEINFDWGGALLDRMSQRPIQIANAPGCWRSHDDIRIIISLGLTRLAVTREFMLPSGNSIGEVEKTGLIYLSRPSKSDNIELVNITMPFMLLKILNKMLQYTSEGPVIPDHLLLIPNKDRPWLWQDFEVLHGYYQKALIEALINLKDAKVRALEDRIGDLKKELAGVKGAQAYYIEKEISHLTDEKQKNWHLSDVFRGAKGDAALLQHEVILHKVGVFTEKERFLTLSKDTALFNTQVTCDDGITRDLMNGIYHHATNNANMDYRWAIDSVSGKPLAIFMQDKHSLLETTNSEITYKELFKWYTTTLESVRRYRDHYDVVLVFFTNRVCKGSSDLSDMPQLLLIDSDCIQEYLSPSFAHRGLVKPENNYESEQILSVSMDMQ